MNRKGIILAGGTGSRLHPSTIALSKQLIPVFDKPMIYYPLSVLMEAGIKDILIITTPHEQAAFKTLLQDGQRWGVNLQYAVQPKPEGLAQALIIAEAFLGGAPCAMILGDNLFFGESFNAQVKAAMTQDHGATIFGYHVKDAQRYGVVGFDGSGKAVSLEEKPEHPKSNYAVTGLYFYDERASAFAKTVKPSGRDELEITDVNRLYMEDGSLSVELLGRGNTWLDTGTHRSLLQAAQFVSVIEEREGRRICCPEIIAFENGWIDEAQLRALAKPLEKSGYGKFFLRYLDEVRA